MVESWAFVVQIPSDKYACHNCDNHLCVNPDHLFIGSPKDNTQDAINKGRWGRNAWTGDLCSKGHRLTPKSVIEYVGYDGYKRRRCKICLDDWRKQYWQEHYARPRPPQVRPPPDEEERIALTGTSTCKRGHEFTAGNTGWRLESGYWKRYCKRCKADSSLASDRRKRGVTDDLSEANRLKYPNERRSEIQLKSTGPPESIKERIRAKGRSQCDKGHAFTESNERWKFSDNRWSRQCKKCLAEYMREYLKKHSGRFS